MIFNEQFVQSVVPTAVWHGPACEDLRLSVDSRTIENGEFFVAIKGSQNDGHAYIAQALEKGAVGALIARDSAETVLPLLYAAHKTAIVVADPLSAVIALAHAWRALIRCPVVGITGSVGKTSTKELATAIFAQAGKAVIASRGTINTLIGAAITILRVRKYHEYVLLEVGISRRGEMARIASLIQPNRAVITMIGHSHMEGLGSLSDIAREKREIFSWGGASMVGIVNGDTPHLAAAYVHPVIRFGTKTTNQIQARRIRISSEGISCVVKIYGDSYPVCFPTVHEGRITITLAAVALAESCAIDRAAILKTIREPLRIDGRFALKEIPAGRGMIIDDAYNASPESMRAALMAFDRMALSFPKIAILGDMRELSTAAPFWHRQVGRMLRKTNSIERVILVGNDVQWIEKTAPSRIIRERVLNWQEASARLHTLLAEKPAAVLVKASRGVALENIVRTVLAPPTQ
jgi:UDP-N-acetylmuramoyl-tripeptide--D-alanyl-D-alanine ligase